MKFLVIGGAGFIGSTLVDRLLAEGHAVDVLDDLSSGSLANLASARADRSYDFTFHRLDVNDPVVETLLERRRPEVVVHLGLAAQLADELAPGFAELLSAVAAAGARKMVVGLDATMLYSPQGEEAKGVGEVDVGTNITPLGVATKRLIDELKRARKEAGLEFTALAMATVYGPRQPSCSQLSSLILDCQTRPAVLSETAAQVGPPVAAAVDLVFVDDAVDALDRAVERGDGLTINVGSGETVTLAEIRAACERSVAALLLDPAERPLEIPQPATVAHRFTGFPLDCSRAEMQLGWQPWTLLTEGLALTTGWIAVNTV